MLGTLSAGLLLGGVLSVSVLWLASGLFSPLPEAVRYGALLLVALLCVLRDAGAVRLPLPQNARQIPQEVLQRHLLRGALQFGFELGTGVRTYVTASAPYAVAVAVLLHGDLGPALLVGVGFGAGRALTPLVRLASGSVTAWDDRLEERQRRMKVAAASAVVLTLAAAVAGL